MIFALLPPAAGLVCNLLVLAPARAADATAPPPPPTAVLRFRYSGAGGQGDYTAAEIASFIVADRTGAHFVWVPGWPAWRSWNEVPEIAKVVPPLPPQVAAPVAQPSGGARFQYAGADGTTTELDSREIARRVRASPSSPHYVWRVGYAAWVKAQDVPEIAAAVATISAAAPAVSPGFPPPAAVSAPPAAPMAWSSPVATAAPEPVLVPPPLPVEIPPLPAFPPPTTVPSNPPSGEPGMAAAAQKSCCSKGLSAQVGGEVWFDLAAPDLENIGDPEVAFVPAFYVGRARMRADLDLGTKIHVRSNIDFPQDGTETTYQVEGDVDADNVEEGETVAVKDAPDGWTTIVKDLYVDWSFGKARQSLRIGVQKPIFGNRDWYEGYDQYFLGGLEAYKTLAWRAGVIPSRDLGASYHVEPNDVLRLDAQVANGTGERRIEDNAGKDFSARLSIEPHGPFSVEGSALYGLRGDKNADSTSAFSLGVAFRKEVPRLLVEGIIGDNVVGEDSAGMAGFMITGALNFDLDSPSLDRFVLLGRFMTWDPNTTPESDTPSSTDFDAWGIGDVSTQLYWKTANPKWVLLTGLNYEIYVPQNMDLVVTHSLVAQVAWKF